LVSLPPVFAVSRNFDHLLRISVPKIGSLKNKMRKAAPKPEAALVGPSSGAKTRASRSPALPRHGMRASRRRGEAASCREGRTKRGKERLSRMVGVKRLEGFFWGLPKRRAFTLRPEASNRRDDLGDQAPQDAVGVHEDEGEGDDDNPFR